ncbi:hypothetical protein ACVWZD_000145 [Streptomyces sp. TE3672]|uniref:hypothetical protein n=1 Tax=unclassified Streptomyces TaxID=2593676 RepID=UPI000F5C1A57|nr:MULTISPECIES: hypothetical protein [unclassified Streptomyces]RPK56520.1 hypothetical protein EES42_40860 [Streptomyces sp. ADI95-17]WSC30011.1 hypothetical protein OG902_26825 [Streptomyces sp. NBC_01768]
MAWDEWEQLKVDARARRQEGMSLDSAPAAGGGGGSGDAADLKTNQPGKKIAVKALRESIRPGTDKAGRHADESSSSAVREFSGWDTGTGLKDAHAEWELQVRDLKARLAKDQEDLEGAHRDLQYVDYDVRSGVAGIDAGSAPRREV